MFAEFHAAMTIFSMVVVPVVFMVIAGLAYLVHHIWAWIDDGDSDVGNNAFLTLIGRIHGFTRVPSSSSYRCDRGYIVNDNMYLSWIVKLALTGFMAPIMWYYPLAGLMIFGVVAVPFLLRTLVRFNKKIKKLEEQDDKR